MEKEKTSFIRSFREQLFGIHPSDSRAKRMSKHIGFYAVMTLFITLALSLLAVAVFFL
ncbi:hypothetical protein JHJ32_03255 [Parapedobacter sp. ISTM3]|uniref:Uncharacterized protein n=1 Tax=Parapedobacter luteus TaxID=623280 RepID=A0A1T5CE48_9SPHI|nr:MULTISPECIES: hypothetical protein [Parapedobacter]MBK1438995.1 hypothetical protein [Parapedobacter sp. ISTM3]SKB57714.1 hypothetical protein SAMN05660226_02136 [Parapedobacter luteus]